VCVVVCISSVLGASWRSERDRLRAGGTYLRPDGEGAGTILPLLLLLLPPPLLLLLLVLPVPVCVRARVVVWRDMQWSVNRSIVIAIII
jgi:hypothetical protein